MRYPLLAIALFLAAAQHSWAQETAEVPPADAPAAETAASPATAEAPSVDPDEELKQKIRSRVLKFVDKTLEAAGDELSDEEKKEILAEIEQEFESEAGGHGLTIDLNSSGESWMESLTGLVVGSLAVALIFGTPIIIVIAILYAGYRKRRMVQETISQYLSSGKEVPPEILENLQGAVQTKNYLQKGLVLTGAGIGIIAAFAAIGWTEAAFLGLIPMFIGLAQLLIWKLENRGQGAKE